MRTRGRVIATVTKRDPPKQGLPERPMLPSRYLHKHEKRQDDDDLHPCPEPGRQGRAKPAGRAVDARPRGSVYRAMPPGRPYRQPGCQKGLDPEHRQE